MFRFLHRIYANFFGYFWLPCRVCGECFGGHELGHGFTAAMNVEEEDGLHAYSVCPKPDCSKEAVRLNLERGYPQYVPHDFTNATAAPRITGGNTRSI